MTRPVIVANVGSSVFMTGMIWTIQVVHYPFFDLIADQTFVAAISEHQRRITMVILLPWAVEGITSLWLALDPPDTVGRALPLAGLVSAGVAVAATVGLSVPAHSVLSDGVDAAAIRRLVSTNWVRTAAWTAHGAIALWIASRAAARS